MLCLLWHEGLAGRLLSSDVFNQRIMARGQTKPLNRAQHLRLITSLEAFFKLVPELGLLLHYPPRKTTMGPWQLFYKDSIKFVDSKDTLPVQSDPQHWPYPKLLSEDEERGSIDDSARLESKTNSIVILHDLMLALLNSDAFAVNGEYKDAIEEQSSIYGLSLSQEFRHVLNLREALWSKRIGLFDHARQLAKSVIVNPSDLDMGLSINANFFLHRISYDESPGQMHAKLWDAATVPTPTKQSDVRTMPEWHNLRALLARRRLLSIENIDKNKDAILDLHKQTINHMQSALYWAVQFRDWDRLQSYVANVSFYLQSVLQVGLSTISEVFMWHKLCINYGDKLYLSQDSGWEYIFFAEFWLDHHSELSGHTNSDPVAHTVDNSHPNQKSFYTRGIAKLAICADARQKAIMWILYGRFVIGHLAQNETTIADELLVVCLNLHELLQKEPDLRERLQKEGYGDYLNLFTY